MIRHYKSNDDFLFVIFQDAYQRATGKPLQQRKELRRFLRAIPHWTYYHLGWACAVYQRVIQQQNYGPSKNPGLIDFGFAAYLPSIDRFITQDHRQYYALRLINVFNTRHTEVLKYTTLRKRLLLS